MTYTTEYNDQLAAIQAAILAVDDPANQVYIGRVHDRPRHGDFMQRWVTSIEGVDQIRAWEIAPNLNEVNRREQSRRHRYRTWQITGVVGLTDMAAEEDEDNPPGDVHTDASFHTINRLAGEIADSIDTAREAHVAAGTWIHHDPTQISEPTVVTIGGGALCWGVILLLRGYTIVT